MIRWYTHGLYLTQSASVRKPPTVTIRSSTRGLFQRIPRLRLEEGISVGSDKDDGALLGRGGRMIGGDRIGERFTHRS